MRFLCGFILLFLLFALPAQGEEMRYMRVVARDDSPAAQREKLMVRGAALLCYPNCVQLENMFSDCRVERKIWKPNNETAPAETVYITIGQGQGRNWWGILYPDSVSWVSGEGEGDAVEITFPFLQRLIHFIRTGEWIAAG